MKFNKLIFASRNRGKIAEITEMLAPLGIEVVSALDVNLPEVDETGTTFEENAALKALSGAKIAGVPCLADDSGLCVNALNGRPGVYSARYAPDRNFDKGMDKLLAEIAQTGNADRSAYFAACWFWAFRTEHINILRADATAPLLNQKPAPADSALIRCLFRNGMIKLLPNLARI